MAFPTFTLSFLPWLPRLACLCFPACIIGVLIKWKGWPYSEDGKRKKIRTGSKVFGFLPTVWKETIIALLLEFACQQETIWIDVPEPFLDLSLQCPSLSFSLSPSLFLQSSLGKVHLRFSWHSDNKRAVWAAGKSCAWRWVGDKEVTTVSEITGTSGTSSRYLLISDE